MRRRLPRGRRGTGDAEKRRRRQRRQRGRRGEQGRRRRRGRRTSKKSAKSKRPHCSKSGGACTTFTRESCNSRGFPPCAEQSAPKDRRTEILKHKPLKYHEDSLTLHSEYSPIKFHGEGFLSKPKTCTKRYKFGKSARIHSNTHSYNIRLDLACQRSTRLTLARSKSR